MECGIETSIWSLLISMLMFVFYHNKITIKSKKLRKKEAKKSCKHPLLGKKIKWFKYCSIFMLIWMFEREISVGCALFFHAHSGIQISYTVTWREHDRVDLNFLNKNFKLTHIHKLYSVVEIIINELDSFALILKHAIYLHTIYVLQRLHTKLVFIIIWNWMEWTEFAIIWV